MTRNQYQDLRKDIIDRIIDKDWFKIEEPLMSPYSYEKGKTRIVIRRICGESIYKQHDSNEWNKLDKYFIEIIHDILKKYNIDEIGFVGDLVDGTYEKGDIEYYEYNIDTDKWHGQWSPNKWIKFNSVPFFNTPLTQKQVTELYNKTCKIK